MINKIRKLGKTPIKAPSGNNPTPAPIAVAIPVIKLVAPGPEVAKQPAGK